MSQQRDRRSGASERTRAGVFVNAGRGAHDGDEGELVHDQAHQRA